jgi:transposase
VIVPEPPTATPQTPLRLAKPGDDRIEIVLARGRRIIVGAGVDAVALSRILDVLERR